MEEHNHTHIHTHNEKKAPTDESIRLLSEFEQKAKSKIIESIHLNNTIIDAIAIRFTSIGIGANSLPSTNNEQSDYEIRFKINGKDIHIKGIIKPYEDWKESIALNKRLIEVICQKIMEEVFKQIYKEINKMFNG